jgi:hypothetical protein
MHFPTLAPGAAARPKQAAVAEFGNCCRAWLIRSNFLPLGTLVSRTTGCSVRKLRQVGLEKMMSRRRGSFQDRDEVLERFGHKGTPAALDDQLQSADPTPKKSRGKSRSFQLNQSLFERSRR